MELPIESAAALTAGNVKARLASHELFNSRSTTPFVAN
jgi:hypothetical protein